MSTTKIVICIMLISITIVGFAVSDSVITNGRSDIEGVGQNEAVKLSLINGSKGLSGYNITLQISNPSIATFLSVSFPPWATIHRNSSFTNSSVWLKAIDLTQEVEVSSSNIELATISVKSLSIGNTQMNIIFNQIDDDDGNPIPVDNISITLRVIQEDSGDSSSSNQQGKIIYVDNDEGNNFEIQPVAESGGPYNGVVNQTILFDGSLSIDPDGGSITSWRWDFGDDTIGTDMISQHIYSKPGLYYGSLTVTDDENTSSSQNFTVRIILQNTVPSKPEIIGVQSGTVNTSYIFEMYSLDNDNNSIQYTIDWGDGSFIETSSFLPNGSSFTSTHEWMRPGQFIIWVTASDNISVNQSARIVLIDSIYIDDLGLIIDENSDGLYDRFESEEGHITNLSYENGYYLINTDDDGTWDYRYNEVSGLIECKNIIDNDINEENFIISGIFILSIISVLIIIHKKYY